MRSLHIPSKTFLIGEYLVLTGHPAVVACTEPHFRFSWCPVGDSSPSGSHQSNEALAPLASMFHPESPAGRWLERLSRKQIQDLGARFIDPHQGLGGFGGSTAEFLGVWWLSHSLASSQSQPLGPCRLEQWMQQQGLSWKRLWQDYRDVCLPSETGLQPSGVDLLAQAFTSELGGTNDSSEDNSARLVECPVLVQYGFGSQALPQKLEWDFALFPELRRSGHKVATHRHLATLQLESMDDLKWAYADFIDALTRKDYHAVKLAVRQYHLALVEHGWVADTSLQQLTQLWEKGITAKGCGAMGADVLAVFPS